MVLNMPGQTKLLILHAMFIIMEFLSYGSIIGNSNTLFTFTLIRPHFVFLFIFISKQILLDSCIKAIKLHYFIITSDNANNNFVYKLGGQRKVHLLK